MIQFNELRITEDRKCLIVDCEIENNKLYSQMYIDNIFIDYYKNVSVVGTPSEKAYLLYGNTESDQRVRGVKRTMSLDDLKGSEMGIDEFKDGLFYVIVICGGAPTEEAASLPCGMDEDMEIGAVLDWKSFYEKGMQHIGRMISGCGDPCDVPAGFEQFILLWNALKLALAVCDWDAVAQLWDELLSLNRISGNGMVAGGGCGCGR